MPLRGKPGSRPPVTAYIALGSNLGDRQSQLEQALCLIAAHKAICLVKASSLYETDPVGFTDQPDFYNAVVKVRTVLPPFALLRFCQSIERRLGRRRGLRWGPRTVDIDLLLYDRLVLQTNRLILPHPRMRERDFVMVPLREILDNRQNPTRAVRLVTANWVGQACYGQGKKLK